MDFKQFVKRVEEELTARCPKKRVVINESLKNNGIKLTGLTLISEGVNVSPTIYLDGFYNSKVTEYDIDSIVDDIIKMYEENKVDDKHYDTGRWHSIENVINDVHFSLVNWNNNQDLLSKLPHRKFLDLAIVYRVKVDINIHGDEIEQGSFLVNNEMLKMWNTTEEKLYDLAYQNTPEILGVRIDDMIDILMASFVCECCDEKDDKVELESLLKEGINPGNILIISNQRRMYGASVLVNREFMNELYEKVGHPVYIIPSSIHECLVINENAESNKESQKLRDIVYEVNRSNTIASDEILSDSVYKLSAGGELSVVA